LPFYASLLDESTEGLTGGGEKKSFLQQANDLFQPWSQI
jgi:hypothetical protein